MKKISLLVFMLFSLVVIGQEYEDDIVDNGKNSMNKNGFAIELLPGMAITSDPAFSEPSFGGALQLGSKFYFGSNEFWKPGLAINWLRFGVYSNSEAEGKHIHFAMINPGFTNVFTFKENIGLEANFFIGADVNYTESDKDTRTRPTAIGFAYTAEVKFRYKKLGVGINYLGSAGGYLDDEEGSTYYHSAPPPINSFISLTIGVKF